MESFARQYLKPRTDFESAPAWFHEGQLQAWENDAEDILIIAGTQGGKTAMLARWMLREISRCKDIVAELGRGDFLYVGPTLTLLEAQALPSFEACFVGEFQLGRMYKGNKPKFEFSKEGLLEVFGTDKYPVTVHFAYANDSSNLESLTALACVWDEVGQKENKEASYEACNRRLKLARSRGYGRRLFGTTPYEWNWFKRRVYDRAIKGEAGYSCVNFVSWMNPNVSEESCRQELLNGMPEWRWRMMYLGRYEKPAGAVYDCVSDETFVDRFDIPKHWEHIVGIDFGPVHNAAVALAKDPQTGIFYMHRDYLRPCEDARTAAMLISQLGGEKTRYVGGAPSENEWRTTFYKASLPVAQPPFKDVLTGIQRVYQLIRSGRLKIFRDLEETVGEIETYSYVLDPLTGEVAEPIKVDDPHTYHRLDALRYACSVIPIGVSVIESRRPVAEVQETVFEGGKNLSGKHRQSVYSVSRRLKRA